MDRSEVDESAGRQAYETKLIEYNRLTGSAVRELLSQVNISADKAAYDGEFSVLKKKSGPNVRLLPNMRWKYSSPMKYPMRIS